MAAKSSIFARLALASLGLAVVIPSLLPQGVSAATVASAYKRVSYNGYSFEVPAGWKASIHMDGDYNLVSFKDAKQNNVGSLGCFQRLLPIEGAYLQDESSRHLINNGFLYRVYLNILTDTHGDDSFAIIDMDHVGYRSSALGDSDPGYGCRLHVTTAGYGVIARHVYKSIRIDGWKTLTAAGVTMKYPAAWTLGSTKKSTHDTSRDFTDLNGRVVASLTCPVPPQGFEGFGGDSQVRTLRRSGSSYSINWKFGTSRDESNHVTYYLDQVTWGKNPSKDGCRIISELDGQHGFFREIYKSLK